MEKNLDKKITLIKEWEQFNKRSDYLKLSKEDKATYRKNLALFKETAPKKVLKAFINNKDLKDLNKVDGRLRKEGMPAPAVIRTLNRDKRKIVTDHFTRMETDAVFLNAVDDFLVFAMLAGHIVSPSYKLYQMHKEIAHNLQKMEDESILGAVFSAPPRSGKTKIIDLYAAWQVGKYPHLHHYIITYGEDLSIEHTMQIRDIMKSNIYKKIFPKVVIRKDVDSKIKMMTVQGGIISALGRGSGISGKTMHRIYIDDLVKEAQEIRSPSIRDTLKDITSNIIQRRVSGDDVPISELTRIVVIGTRYFNDDPIGEFMDIIKNTFKGPVRNYPAIAYKDVYSDIDGSLWLEPGDYMLPERVNAGAVEVARQSPSYTTDIFNAVYMGITMEDSINFKKEWIKYDTMDNVMAKNLIAFLFIDPAVTVNERSDETGFAIGLLDNNSGIVYVKAWGEKISPKELVEKIFDLDDEYSFKRIGIEKMLFTQGIEFFINDEMERQNRMLKWSLVSHGNKSKELRILGALPGLYEKGIFRHIKGETVKLEEQMFAYPKGKYDDVLDATAGLAAITNGEKEKQRGRGVVSRSKFHQFITW